MTDQRKGLPSASEFPRVVACDGYLQYKREVGPIPVVESEDAALGTKLHDVLYKEGAGKNDLDDRSRWVVEKCLDIRDGIVHEIHGNNAVECIKEKRFWMYGLAGEKICSGQSDYIAISVDTGDSIVINYKTGGTEHEASEGSWQLAMEIACFVEDIAKQQAVIVKNVYAAIVQPLVSLTPTIVRYGTNQISDLQMLIRRKLRESEMPYAPRTPGVQCKFCPLAGSCPESQAYFAVLYPGNRGLDVNTLTPQQIAILIERMPVVKKVMESVRSRAEELAAAGELPGYTMKEGHDLTSVSDIPGFFDAMQANCGITRDEFFRNLTVVKGGLEQIFRERWPVQHGGSKKAASERFEELVRQFGETSKTKARLVPIKQERQIE